MIRTRLILAMLAIIFNLIFGLFLFTVNAQSGDYPLPPIIGEANVTSRGIRFSVKQGGEWPSELKAYYTEITPLQAHRELEEKQVRNGEIFILNCGVESFSIYSMDVEGRKSISQNIPTKVDLICLPPPVLERSWDDVTGLTVKVTKPKPNNKIVYSFVARNSTDRLFVVRNKEGHVTVDDCHADFVDVYYIHGGYSRITTIDARDNPLGKPPKPISTKLSRGMLGGIQVDVQPRLPSNSLLHYEYKQCSREFVVPPRPMNITNNELELDCSIKLLGVYTVNKCGKRSEPFFTCIPKELQCKRSAVTDYFSGEELVATTK